MNFKGWHHVTIVRRRGEHMIILYALTIFVSAFLLFLVQPIIAKQILPWFGGSAAVWTTCLVFFQCMLLAGYFYADWTTRRLSARQQAGVHLVLIVMALLLLPIIPDASWKPLGDEAPGLRILLLLAVTIGLPYFIISTTSPLVQSWFGKSHPGKSPYRLFALSNLASLLALLGYPFLIEPWISTRQQAVNWSFGFVLFAGLIGVLAWQRMRGPNAASYPTDAAPAGHDLVAHASPPSVRDKLIWIVLSGLASVLLLSVSNHLTENIASIPLMWVFPLAVYLLTFILCFDAKDSAQGWYRRKLFLPLLALMLVVMAWTLADTDFQYRLYWQVAVFATGLFVACMFCHGELVAQKPAARYLTTFYLMISIGGAVGALLVGVIAPLTLPAYYELALCLVALAGVATRLTWRKVHVVISMIGVVITLFVAASGWVAATAYGKDTIVMTRSFYGTLRVRETPEPSMEYRRRTLIHGAISHGDQYMWAPIKYDPTTYYKENSGVGRILLLLKSLHSEQPRRVGIVGLGAGTIAAYGAKGDVFRFYEINPDVIAIAKRDFTYLSDSKATIEISLGDARLNLEQESAQGFDVLAIDAFSSDAIPMHLITREAVAIYQKHLRASGVIAFHVSNRYLDLKPVIATIAASSGLDVTWVKETYNDGSTRSDWILLANDRTLLDKPEIVGGARVIPPKPNQRLWTDDFNNLLQALQ